MMLKYRYLRTIRQLHYKVIPSLSEVIEHDSQCYCNTINNTLLKDKTSIEYNVTIPNTPPVYKKHVLLISKGYKSEMWKKGWGSRLEENKEVPISYIARIKDRLKENNCSGILINAIDLYEEQTSLNHIISKDANTASFLVIPEMKIYKVNDNEVEAFADYLDSDIEDETVNKKMCFQDYLQPNDERIKKQKNHLMNIKQFKGKPAPNNRWAFICGHMQRDARCGIIGEQLLNKITKESLLPGFTCGIISHIGGHRYAGNILLYTNNHCLWLGKVTPTNVATIADKLVHHQEVPVDHCRGQIAL